MSQARYLFESVDEGLSKQPYLIEHKTAITFIDQVKNMNNEFGHEMKFTINKPFKHLPDNYKNNFMSLDEVFEFIKYQLS